MADSDQSSRTGATMDPWWRVLKAHGVCVTTKMRASKIVGLHISLIPTDPREASQNVGQRSCALRDALELVFLQSMVDYGAFANTLVDLEHHPSRHYALERLLREECDFPCDFDTQDSFSGTMPEWIRWLRPAISTLVTPLQLHERDQAFQDTRQQLLTAAGTRDGHKMLKISMGVQDSNSVMELANFVPSAPPPSADYPFGQVVLVPSACTTASKESVAAMITCLRDMHKRVRLGRVNIHAIGIKDEEVYGNLLAACFRPEGPSSPSHESVKDDPRASMDMTICPSHRLLTQLCSAVLSAQRVESLTLNWTPVGNQARMQQFWNSRDDQVRFMRSTLVSLFSTLARHSIHQLQLDRFVVDDTDMDDLETFLLGPNQLSVLRCGLLHAGKLVADDEGEATSPSRDQILLATGTKLCETGLPQCCEHRV